MFAFSSLILASYCAFYIIYQDDLATLKYIDEAFGVARAIGMSLNAYMLSASIYKLKRAKVQRS